MSFPLYTLTLSALPEDRPDAVRQPAPIAPGGKPQHLRLAARRIQDAGQHLDRRRFARAIRADEGQQLARLQAEGDAPDCLYLPVLRPDDGLETATQPGFLALDRERLGEVAHFDDGHERIIHFPLQLR